MIIETILTTLDASGKVNVAPMGVEWGGETIVIKPFIDTTTFRNLQATSSAVVNLTDDVGIFVRAALLSTIEPTGPAVVVNGVVLNEACSWHELEVTTIDATPPRSRIQTRVVHREVRREFLGFNRARHAVLEATILATRLHLVPHDEVRRQIEALQILVDKTAGPRELDAWSIVTSYVQQRITPA